MLFLPIIAIWTNRNTSLLIGEVRSVKHDTVTVVIPSSVKATWYPVTISCYYPTGRTTYMGDSVDEKNPIKHRFIGLAHNLLKRYNRKAPFDFGDTVVLIGAIPYQGIYYVRDTGSPKIRGRADILIGLKDTINLWKNCLITKLTNVK